MYAIRFRMLIGFGLVWSLSNFNGERISRPASPARNPEEKARMASLQLPRRAPIGFLVPNQILLEKVKH